MDSVSFFDRLLERHGSPEGAVAGLRARCGAEDPVGTRLDLQVFLNLLGREEESFAVSEELIRMAPRDPRVLFNHGWHWLKRGQLQKGCALLEHGRLLNTYGHPPLPSSQPLWSPNPAENQHVLLSLEGGFGDEIIHFRFGRDLARLGCRVTVICHPSLAELFARQPWVSSVAQREAAPGIYHTSWLPGMSASRVLGYEYEDLSGEPYLAADPKRVRDWGKLLGAKKGELKIGLRWAGSPAFEHQQFRLFPPEILLSLAGRRGARFFSFQRDNNLVDLPAEVTDLAPHLRTWDDTAAALANMDLVISSCTSVAHLSAALGRKTWVVVPVLPYFVWALPGRESPWYRSVRLFRQERFGEWSGVGGRLAAELDELLSAGATES